MLVGYARVSTDDQDLTWAERKTPALLPCPVLAEQHVDSLRFGSDRAGYR